MPDAEDRVSRLLLGVQASARPLLIERQRLSSELKRIDRILAVLEVDPTVGSRPTAPEARARMSESARLREAVGYEPHETQTAICLVLEAAGTALHRADIYRRALDVHPTLIKGTFDYHLSKVRERGLIVSAGRSGYWRLTVGDDSRRSAHIGEMPRVEQTMPHEARDAVATTPAHLLNEAPMAHEAIAFGRRHGNNATTPPLDDDEELSEE